MLQGGGCYKVANVANVANVADVTSVSGVENSTRMGKRPGRRMWDPRAVASPPRLLQSGGCGIRAEASFAPTNDELPELARRLVGTELASALLNGFYANFVLHVRQCIAYERRFVEGANACYDQGGKGGEAVQHAHDLIQCDGVDGLFDLLDGA